MTQFRIWFTRTSVSLACLFLLISCYGKDADTPMYEQDNHDELFFNARDDEGPYRPAIHAKDVSNNSDHPTDIVLFFDAKILENQPLSTNVKRKVELSFDMRVNLLGSPVYPEFEAGNGGWVVLSQPEDFSVTIGDETFAYSGVQYWFAGHLFAEMEVEVEPDNTIDQFSFTLNGKEPISIQVNYAYADPAFTAAVERDPSTGARNMKFTFSGDILSPSIKTQFVTVNEANGQPILDDANIQSRCDHSGIINAGSNPSSPVIIPVDELLENAPPGSCSTDNAALVRLSYYLRGAPTEGLFENGFDAYSSYTGIAATRMRRYVTLWVPLPK